MLKPFSPSDAKKPRRRSGKAQPQATLFTVAKPKPAKRGGVPLDRQALPLAELSALWDSMDVENVGQVQTAARVMSSALSDRLGGLYGSLRPKVSNALDVAAYLVLRELHGVAEHEVPGKELEVLDFGVNALRRAR